MRGLRASNASRRADGLLVLNHHLCSMSTRLPIWDEFVELPPKHRQAKASGSKETHERAWCKACLRRFIDELSTMSSDNGMQVDAPSVVPNTDLYEPPEDWVDNNVRIWPKDFSGFEDVSPSRSLYLQ